MCVGARDRALQEALGKLLRQERRGPARAARQRVRAGLPRGRAARARARPRHRRLSLRPQLHARLAIRLPARRTHRRQVRRCLLQVRIGPCSSAVHCSLITGAQRMRAGTAR